MKILTIAKEKAQERVKIESLLSYKVELLTDLKTRQAEIDRIKKVENEVMSKEFRDIINSRKKTYQEDIKDLSQSIKETDKIIKNLMSRF